MEYLLEKLEVFNMAEQLSDEIWNLVIDWNYFQKDTIGKQIVRAADSISANISEGYGRYYFKESKQFYFYSRGSILETKSWLSKCMRRQIIEKNLYIKLIERTDIILLKLNAFIKFLAKAQKKK